MAESRGPGFRFSCKPRQKSRLLHSYTYQSADDRPTGQSLVKRVSRHRYLVGQTTNGTLEIVDASASATPTLSPSVPSSAKRWSGIRVRQCPGTSESFWNEHEIDRESLALPSCCRSENQLRRRPSRDLCPLPLRLPVRLDLLIRSRGVVDTISSFHGKTSRKYRVRFSPKQRNESRFCGTVSESSQVVGFVFLSVWCARQPVRLKDSPGRSFFLALGILAIDSILSP